LALACKPLNGSIDDLALVGGRIPGEHRGTRLKAHGDEKLALCHGVVHSRSADAERVMERLEVDMGSKIALAGMIKDTAKLMVADRLKRIAGRRLEMAVVDYERRARTSREPGAYRACDCFALRRSFNDCALPGGAP